MTALKEYAKRTLAYLGILLLPSCAVIQKSNCDFNFDLNDEGVYQMNTSNLEEFLDMTEYCNEIKFLTYPI